MSGAVHETETILATLLDALCPMHAILGPDGRIRHAGPTLAKLDPEGDPQGRMLEGLIQLRRPRCDGSMGALRALAGVKLHMQLRDGPRTDLKGLLVPLPDTGLGDLSGGAVLNLSFGISVQDAVRDFALTGGDFAATDLTVEMLYVIEAKSAAMEASRKLNQKLQGAKVAAEEQAFTDTLTGLKNRRALDEILARLMDRDRDFALLNVDLDFFKAVNDAFGHAAGDHVLQCAARAMVEETRAADTVARIGGDEFVVILDDVTDPSRVGEIAARLVARLEEPISYQGQTCRISASIGAALSRDYPSPRGDVMLHDADRALYTAKDRGRGRYVLHASRPGSATDTEQETDQDTDHGSGNPAADDGDAPPEG